MTAHEREPLLRIVPAADIPPGGRRLRLEATAGECAALAASLRILAVDSLAAEFALKPVADGSIAVVGALDAAVVQTDVVTLEPVRQAVSEAIDLVLTPAEPPLRQGGRSLAPAEAEDQADTFVNGRIDLGAIVREHLALGLDPYPRAPDTAFEPRVEDAPERDPSPFAQLAALSRPKAD